MNWRRWQILMVLFLLSISLPVFGQQGVEPKSVEPTGADSAKPGINDDYLDPNLDVDKFVQRFEIESREIFTSRQEIVRVLQINPGERMADVGAGTGFFSLMFAEQVGEAGWVYAVDIAPRFIVHIRDRIDAGHVRNVTPILCTRDQANLAPNSVDKVFICDTYHHFEHFKSTSASIFKALKPNGQLYVVDFERIEGKSRPWILGHVRAGKDEVKNELIKSGFEFVEEISISGFAENYMLKFRKQVPQGN